MGCTLCRCRGAGSGVVAGVDRAQHGVAGRTGQALLEHLGGYLAQRDVLLIVDNFEQVLAAAGFLAPCSASRRGRGLGHQPRAVARVGEQEFAVPPLHVPGRGSVVSAASLAACESVQLFVGRAGASVPGFAVTAENAAAIADIVERLDGLPLAIELAAAWVKLLSPEAISARLAHSLGLLVGGRRDVPERQRTLRAAIGWSYDLLTEPARGCSRCARCSAAVSTSPSRSVAAALGVGCGDPSWWITACCAPTRAAAPRFVTLETVREFAAEQLREMPEQERCGPRTLPGSGSWPRIWNAAVLSRPGGPGPART